jgi:hypothetical protein
MSRTSRPQFAHSYRFAMPQRIMVDYEDGDKSHAWLMCAIVVLNLRVDVQVMRRAFSFPRSTEDWSDHLHALSTHLRVVAPDVPGEHTQVALALCACGHFDCVLELGGRVATAAEHVMSLGVETFEFIPLPRLTVRVRP